MRPVSGIHDLLFKQRVADAHDQRAEALRLSRFQIDDEAAILNRDHLFDGDNAGFGVDLNFGHLHAADAAVGEVGRLAHLIGIIAVAGNGRALRSWSKPVSK